MKGGRRGKKGEGRHTILIDKIKEGKKRGVRRGRASSPIRGGRIYEETLKKRKSNKEKKKNKSIGWRKRGGQGIVQSLENMATLDCQRKGKNNQRRRSGAESPSWERGNLEKRRTVEKRKQTKQRRESRLGKEKKEP